MFAVIPFDPLRLRMLFDKGGSVSIPTSYLDSSQITQTDLASRDNIADKKYTCD